MKTRISFVALQTVFTALLLTFCLSAFSQKTTIWKGGTPGRETDWNCPSNWSTHTVPDAFSDVVIPDVATSTRVWPVIFKGEVEVNALHIHPNAGLTISRAAALLVIGELNSVGVQNLHAAGDLFVANYVSFNERPTPRSAQRPNR